MNTADDRFYGRSLILQQIKQASQGRHRAGFVLVGGPLTGKSLTLQQLAAHFTPAQCALTVAGPETHRETYDKPHTVLPLLLACAGYTSLSELAKWITAGLQQASPDPARNAEAAPHYAPEQPFSALADALASGSAQGHLPLLLLDDFDHLLANLTQQEELRTFIHHLNTYAIVVIATHEPLYDLPGALAALTQISHWRQCFLGLIEVSEATQWLASYEFVDQQLQQALLLLSGRHPFLLDRLGDALAEVKPLLPAVQQLGAEHLPLLQLRLAEHGRPLFWAQHRRLQAAIGTATGAAELVERLRRTPLPPAQIPPELTPALNWLINQAMIRYTAGATGLIFSLFSPLLADFLDHISPSNASQTVIKPAPEQAEGDRALFDKLTKTEASLLRYFQRHSQKVVSTEQLLADVWKRPHASNRRVQEAIRRLRRQLQQEAPPVGDIRNERGRGYRFVPHQQPMQDSG